MENFEKLLILLEMKGIDISPFIKIKKNELLLSGSKEIASDVTYYELIKNYNKYLESDNLSENPFFSGLGDKKQVNRLEEIIIHNYKNDKYQKITEILFDDNIIDTQKQDIIYRGFQKLSNEYKNFLNSVINNNIFVIKNYFKLKGIYNPELEPKWVKKRNLLFWFCALLLIIFNYYFVNDSNIYKNPLYYYLSNIIFNLLVLFPFIKLMYCYYLDKKTNYYQKKLNKLLVKFENIKDLNDKNIDKFEKSLYYFYSNTSKTISISYLIKTNRKLKQLNNKIIKIMSMKIYENIIILNRFIIKTLNIILPLSFIGLIILFFIIN